MDNNMYIEAVLRQSEYGRTNNFDIIQKTGYTFLREEIVADFPYLKLHELRTIITNGVKGKIEQGKTIRPLNCTRIYQWVERSMEYAVSYWQFTHPSLFAWVEQLDLINEFKRTINTYQTPGEAFCQPHKFRQLLQRVVREALYPNLDIDSRNNVLNAAKFQHQTEQYLHVSTIEYPAYLLQYPDPNTSSQPLF